MEDESKRVIFETDAWVPQSIERSRILPGMVRLVIKSSGGYVKTEQGANVMLIIFALLIFVVSVFIGFRAVSSPSSDSQSTKINDDIVGSPRDPGLRTR